MSTIKSKKRDKIKHSANAMLKKNGQAKKGGGGGKGTWGRAGDEYKYDDDEAYLDWKDPNYDYAGEEHGGFYFSSIPAEKVEKAFAASIKMQGLFKDKIREAGKEYFKALDKNEFKQSVADTKMRDSLLFHEIVKEVLKLALDRGDKGLHASSELFRYLMKEKVIDSRHVYKGFYHLFNQIDELTMDCPKAKQHLLYMLECSLLLGLDQKQIDHLKASLKHTTDPKTLKKTKGAIEQCVKEYMDSEDASELVRCFTEMKVPFMGHELVKKAVSIALDRGTREKELVSLVIAEVSGRSVSREEVDKGFEILLQRVEDLHMDVPKILEHLSAFVARAVADEALAPSFLLQVHIQQGDGGYEVVQQAQRLLAKRGATQRLSRVWGPSSGDSIHKLKKNVKDLVDEFFASNDMQEAIQLVKTLPPHFRHEVVKRTFVLALSRQQRELDLCASFLKTLEKHKVIWRTQLERGIARIERNLDDMALDNLKAKEHYAELIQKLNIGPSTTKKEQENTDKKETEA
mmetsp:Transcript_12720/g.17759  ORF Transcript_12720/g.17759 Transcript_12720/m.17759 type:complete len:517 (-) Transcript_12720:234-1784(-)